MEAKLTFKQGDRVKFKPGATTAAGPPDRRRLTGMVLARKDLSGFANGVRINVLFDGENTPEEGFLESLFDLAEPRRY